MRISFQIRILALVAGIFSALEPSNLIAQTSANPKEISEQEWERRAKICFRSEKWLAPSCMAELKTFQITENPEKPTSPIVQVEPASPPSVDEMHMIGIYEPAEVYSNDGNVRRGEALIKVDRPGAKIALVLGSYDPVHWKVVATPGTEIIRIIYSGRGARRSEVSFEGDGAVIEIGALSPSYRASGPMFHLYHRAAATLVGVNNADSFQGAYRPPGKGFTVSAAPGVLTLDEEQAALYDLAINSEDLSASMRAALSRKAPSYVTEWKFGDDGFERMDLSGQIQRFEVPLEFPEVSWPVGSAYDPDTKTIWGVTLGGKGYLYTYKIDDAQWSVRSMENFDAGGLTLDVQTGYLVATPSGFHSGKRPFLVMDLNANVVSTFDVSVIDFPGWLNTFGPGSARTPKLTPLLAEGGKILVRTGSQFHRSTSSLVYLIDLNEGIIRLVRE